MNDVIQVSGTWHFLWSDSNGNEIRCRTEKNLIVNTGLAAIAAILVDELAQDCAVYLAMGTGTTAPAANNTKLENEAIRKMVTTKTRSSGTVIYRFYFLTGEAVGDFDEWGVFLEATSAADSGRLLNRLVPTGGVSKASNENLTVEVQIALAAA